jgi:hypothetical protein
VSSLSVGRSCSLRRQCCQQEDPAASDRANKTDGELLSGIAEPELNRTACFGSMFAFDLGGALRTSGAVGAKLANATPAVAIIHQRLLGQRGTVMSTYPYFAEFIERHMPYRAPRPVRKRPSK